MFISPVWSSWALSGPSAAFADCGGTGLKARKARKPPENAWRVLEDSNL